MARPKKDLRAPNPAITTAINKMMREIDGMEPAERVKVIQTAIAWEKVQRQIKDEDAGSFFGNTEPDPATEN